MLHPPKNYSGSGTNVRKPSAMYVGCLSSNKQCLTCAELSLISGHRCNVGTLEPIRNHHQRPVMQTAVYACRDLDLPIARCDNTTHKYDALVASQLGC